MPDAAQPLPPYTQSLLKVSLPVRVQLATKREAIGDIVEIGPGTILTFAKRCDEPLQLYVENQLVAEGEAVKLDDKFGFRVHEIVLPEEHFYTVRHAKGEAEAEPEAADDSASETISDDAANDEQASEEA